MLEWSPPEPSNAMAQGIRIERYELKYVCYYFVKLIYSNHCLYSIALSELSDTFGPFPVNVIGGNSSVFENFLRPGMAYSVILVAVYSNNARARSLPANFTTLVNGTY